MRFGPGRGVPGRGVPGPAGRGLVPSGPGWLATPGRFFPGWGRHVTEADLAAAAVQEATAAQAAAAAGAAPTAGWCKIIGDWAWDGPPCRWPFSAR